MQAAEDAFGRVSAGETIGAEFSVYRCAPAHILGHHELALKAVEPVLVNPELFAQLSTWASYVLLSAIGLAGVGRRKEAREFLVRYIDEVRRSASRGSLEEIILGFAVLAHMCGDSERASMLLGWVGGRTLDIGRFMPSGTGPPLYVHYVGTVRAALDSETARRRRAEGRSLSEDEAVALALETDIA